MRRMVYGWGPSVTLIRLCILMLRAAPHDIYDTEGYVEEDRYSIDTTLDSLILKGSDYAFLRKRGYIYKASFYLQRIYERRAIENSNRRINS